MEEELKQALLDAGYTEEEIQLETTPGGRVGGFVISSRFSGQTQLERQETLWNQLGERLRPAALDCIVSLLTMTPEETEDDVQLANG